MSAGKEIVAGAKGLATWKGVGMILAFFFVLAFAAYVSYSPEAIANKVRERIDNA